MGGRAARRAGVALLTILLAGLIFFFGLLPGIAERRLNRHTQLPTFAISPAAQALHSDLLVADLHADSLLWNRDLVARSRRGHVDLPRLGTGNVAIQIFSAVIKTPHGQNYTSNRGDSDALRLLLVAQLWPPATWRSLEARAMHQATRLHRTAARSAGRLRVVESRHQLDSSLDSRRGETPALAGVLAIEGLQALEGDLTAIDRLYAAGYRMMGLTHFYDNRIGGSAHGVDKGGLTSLGRQALPRLEQLSILVDLAHASPATFDDVLALATRPVVVSHTGVKATCPGARNLSDTQIRGVAATGGLIGVGYWPGAICGTAPADVIAAIRHVSALVGVRHAALGSDYDGATEVGFDASELAVITDALLADGFSVEEVRAVMGENVAALLRDTLPEEIR